MTKRNPSSRKPRANVVKSTRAGAKRDRDQRADQQARWDALLADGKR